MKKALFVICLILSVGCTKNEIVSPMASSEPVKTVSSAYPSHLNDDDLALIDGSIRLRISKEDALKRGVSVLEYDLVYEQLEKLNESRNQFAAEERNSIAQTKAGTRSINTLDMGILLYQRDNLPFFDSNKRYPIPIGENSSIIIRYTFSSPDEPFDTHELNYNLYGPLSPLSGQITEYWATTGYVPVYNTLDSTMGLEYIFHGDSFAVCVYEIMEGYN